MAAFLKQRVIGRDDAIERLYGDPIPSAEKPLSAWINGLLIRARRRKRMERMAEPFGPPGNS